MDFPETITEMWKSGVSYFISACVFSKLKQLLDCLASHQVAYLVSAVKFRMRAARNICRE